MFIFSFIGTIGFSIIGIVFSIFGSRINSKFIKFLKGFTFGSIISLLITGIFKESIEAFSKINENFSLIFAFLVIVVVFLIFYFVHYIFDVKHHHHEEEIECDDHDFHLHENKSLFITSLLFLLSISLHNIPEGLALGSSFLGDETHGILLSIMVFGLHNFVIAYAICDSFLRTKIHKSKAVALTLSSSIVAYLSAISGYFLGNIGPLFEAILLSVSAGAMLYIILKELLPGIIKNYDTSVAISSILGLIITILIFIYH